MIKVACKRYIKQVVLAVQGISIGTVKGNVYSKVLASVSAFESDISARQGSLIELVKWASLC